MTKYAKVDITCDSEESVQYVYVPWGTINSQTKNKKW